MEKLCFLLNSFFLSKSHMVETRKGVNNYMAIVTQCLLYQVPSTLYSYAFTTFMSFYGVNTTFMLMCTSLQQCQNLVNKFHIPNAINTYIIQIFRTK